MHDNMSLMSNTVNACTQYASVACMHAHNVCMCVYIHSMF